MNKPAEEQATPLDLELMSIGDAIWGGRATEPHLSAALAMLADLPAHRVVEMEDRIRNGAKLWSFMGTSQLAPLQKLFPPTYAGALKREPDLRFLYLFHRVGYMRQAALDMIQAPVPNAFILAAIFLRLNDWVLQVRGSANACLGRVLPVTDTVTVFEAVTGLLHRSRNWARWDVGTDLIADTLWQPEITALALQTLMTARSGRLSKLMRVMLLAPTIDDQLPVLAASAASPTVRALALETLLTGQARWVVGTTMQWIDKTYFVGRSIPVYRTRALAQVPDPVPLIEMGLGDRSALVRKIAARAVVAHADRLPDLPKVVARLLADSSSAMRWRGDFLARQMNPTTN